MTEATTRDKDGQSWQIGTDADVEWVAQGAVAGVTVSAAIPQVFEAYATVAVPAFGEGL